MRSFAIPLLALLTASPVLASENGTQHYPVGINTVTAGNLPPSGRLEYFNYVQDASMTSLNEPDGPTPAPKFKLDVLTSASRLLYSWPGLTVAGLHVSSGVVIPIVHLNVKLAGQNRGAAGIGDIDIQNYLSGSTIDKKLFYFVGLDVTPPTGHYIKNALVNAGNNYYTLTPNAGITWMPSEAWEVTGSIAAEFNTINRATHYRSGTDVDVDYAITYRPLTRVRAFGVGMQGYIFKQLSDDLSHGIAVGVGGNRGQEFAIGPQVRYDTGAGGLVFKYQHLFSVRNRPSGDRVWIQFAAPLF